MLRLMITGNLGADAEVRPVGENFVTNFRIATTRVWTDTEGEKQSETTWFRVAVWSKQFAENTAPYLVSGKKVAIGGCRSIKASPYQADDGLRASLELTVAPFDVELLGSSQDGMVGNEEDEDIEF